MSIAVSDAAGFIAALESATPEDEIELVAPLIELDEPVTVNRLVRLRAAKGASPKILFLAPDAGLALEAGAGGSRIDGITFAGRGYRAGPLLRLDSVDDVTLSEVTIEHSDGAGLDARMCRGLRLQALRIAEIGLVGASFAECDGLAGDVTLAGIGRRGRSAGLLLAGTRCEDLAVTARDVSGNAVTIKPPAAGGQLTLSVSGAFRGLAALGEAERVVTGLEASVVAEDIVDSAVMLSNASALAVTVTARRCGAVPVLLTGAAGARNCRVSASSDQRPGVAIRGASRGNEIADAALADWPEIALPNLSPRPEGRIHEVHDVCSVCGWEGAFRRTYRMVRETYACGRCRATLRYRAQAAALLSEVLGGRLRTLEALSTDPWLAERAVFEPGITGPFRPHFSRAGRYVTSTYWEGGRSGDMRDGRVCQNLSAMSFPDAAFDLVITSDIMEHVRRPREAWAEIRRVLKPGGWHVFSIPVFHPLRPKSVARVDTSGAEDRHLLPPEYHGDGSSGLSLVYTDFGADLLDELASLGLPTKAVVYPGSDRLGRSVVSFVSVAT